MSGPVFLIVVALVGVAVVALLARSLIGQDIEPAYRRYGPPLGPGDVQAIQDAEACALTQPRAIDLAVAPGFTDSQWAELDNAFAADAYLYRSGGGMPGETRTTWTREDYKS